MDFTINEVLQYARENDVKFVRLVFADIFGNLKNISIFADGLEDAFEHGVSFDASAVKGFMNIEESDLFLYPDPTTLAVLPWRPQQGRVIRFFCDIKYPDGKRFEGDGRYLLRLAMEKAESMGYQCQIGPECEFYLFKLDEHGHPTLQPYDNAGYLDIAPLDKCENVRREIVLTLAQMGILPESSHHETGPGQNEIDFRYGSAMQSADNLMTFKTVVSTVAASNGLFACFMAKPIESLPGNGLHVNMSLTKAGKNIFTNNQSKHSQDAESFISGILNRIREITVFLNPTTNSYSRFGYYEAPNYITWSHQNRSQLIRIPSSSNESTRLELCSPDPACNPYIAFSMLIYAGLEGIEKKLPLRDPSNFNLFKASSQQLASIEHLPYSLEEAIEIACGSEFVEKHLPVRIINTFMQAKAEECKEYKSVQNKLDFELNNYFGKI